MAQITYADKSTMNENSSIPAINKCQASDMNEIKSVVNNNYNEVGNITNLTTTDKSSVVNAINEIYDDNYYKPGDTWEPGIYTAVAGYITSGNKDLNFSIEMPKSLKNISTITITTMKIDVRTPSGSYAVNNFNVYDSSVTSRTVSKRDDRCIDISMKRSSNWFGTNNVPVSVAFYATVKLTFN